MRRAHFTIAAITGILLTITCTGCMTSDAASPAPVGTAASKSPPAGVTNGTPAVTMNPVPATPGCASPLLNLWTGIPEPYTPSTVLPPKPGTLVSQADLFGTPTLSWKACTRTMQWRMNPGLDLVKSNGTGKLEIAPENYNGKTTIHGKDSTTFSTSEPTVEPEQLTVTDTWYDEKHMMLFQHRKVSINGDVGEDSDVPVKNLKPDCPGELFTPKWEYAGIDPVTVPAGSYPGAMKYTMKFNTKGTISVWFAPGVPVEVKKVIQDPESEELDTVELTGWG